MSASDGGDAAYPLIEPSSFDLIISGTGLSSSLIASAASAAGKSLLHLDPNPFYGSLFSSLPPNSFQDLLGLPPSPLPEHSRSFSLDLAGPRLLFCADPMVDLLIRSGASNHVEFKAVEGSLIYQKETGGLGSVPDSRQKIFRDKRMGLGEKREMMRFLKLVQGYFGTDADEKVRVLEEEELEMPFGEFLKKEKLPAKIRSIILYAIVLADYDQDSGEECEKVIKTKEGLESMALYIKSVGRLPNAVGAFIYPMYGHGELPQAFCRCAAVKGALYVLRMPVIDLLIDRETKQYKGVKLASGQEILSRRLIMEPPSSRFPSSALSTIHSEVLNASNLTKKVARGVCVTNLSIHLDLLNILVIFPPRSLLDKQLTTVRALQLSSNVAVCPQGMFVVYLCTPCDDANLGKEYIQAAMNALFSLPNQSKSEGVPTNNGVAETSKPTLLWSAVYVQEVTQASFGTFYSCPSPDANLDYRHILESTIKLFNHMYPEEEFLLESPASVNTGEDEGGSSE